MDGRNIAEAAKTIELKAKNKNEFFLIHGYTGSPTDFNKLGHYLHKRFNANVKIMRIVGHGTKIEDLDRLHYKDFLECVEKELKKDLKKRMKIVIGGLCLGSLIAFDLASRYPIKGIFSSSASYKYRFPVNIVSYFEPIIFKKHWKKPITNYEKRARLGSYNYPYVHLRGFKIIKQARKSLKNKWKNINAPCVMVHCNWDKILHYKSDEEIIKRVGSQKTKKFLFESDSEGEHNLFFSPYHKKVYKIFGDFFEENQVFKK